MRYLSLSSKIKPTFSVKYLLLTICIVRLISEYFFLDIFTTREMLLLSSEIFLVRIIFWLWHSVNNIKQIKKDGGSIREQIGSIFPPQLIGLMNLEIAQQKGFFSWVFGRIPQPVVSGQIFCQWKKSHYPTIFLIIMIAAVTDLPLSAFLTKMAFKNISNSVFIQFFVISSSLYIIAWIIADRHLVKHSYHVISENYLHLEVGARFTANIPWRAVVDVRKFSYPKEINENKHQWLKRNMLNASSTIVATPMDQPNIILSVDKSVDFFVDKFKIQRKNIDTLLIYADEPAGFIEAIKNKVSRDLT